MRTVQKNLIIGSKPTLNISKWGNSMDTNHPAALDTPAAISHQRGFTLLELLIALVISSVLLLGISKVLISSAEAQNRVSSIRQLNEDAALLSQFLRLQLAQIAYRPIDMALQDTKQMPIQDTTIKFPAVENEWAVGQVIKADNTSVTFRFSGSDDQDGNPDGSIISCITSPVGEDEIVETQLFLLQGELGCSANSEVEILAGSAARTRVERMLVELGTDSNDDRVVDSMVAAATADESDFINARIVRIRLLLATADRAIKFNQDYSFNNQIFTAPDFRLRKEVVIAMAVRN